MATPEAYGRSQARSHHSNTRSLLTYWVRPWIKPTSSQSPHRVLNPLSHNWNPEILWWNDLSGHLMRSFVWLHPSHFIFLAGHRRSTHMQKPITSCNPSVFTSVVFKTIKKRTGVFWWLSGIRIWHYHCCGWGRWCGTSLIPGPRTSICCRNGKKERNKEKRKKERKGKKWTGLENGRFGAGHCVALGQLNNSLDLSSQTQYKEDLIRWWISKVLTTLKLEDFAVLWRGTSHLDAFCSIKNMVGPSPREYKSRQRQRAHTWGESVNRDEASREGHVGRAGRKEAVGREEQRERRMRRFQIHGRG